MSANPLPALLALLLDEATTPARRSEIESQLLQTEAGRSALAQLAALAAPTGAAVEGPVASPDDAAAGTSTDTPIDTRTDTPADMPAGPTTPRGFRSVDPAAARTLAAARALSEAVMARIPPASPTVYTQVADVVVRAWGDPALREALRRDPGGILRREGVAVPDGARMVVVGPADGRLPDGNEIVLPLPPASRPGVPPDEAVRRLRETPFGWLWGPPWIDPPGQPRAASTRGEDARRSMTGWATALPDTLRAALGGRRRGLVLAFTGAVAAVALWIAVGPAPGSGGASGAAVGDGDMPWAVIVAVVLLAAAVLFAASRRR